MSMNQALIAELKHEAAITRKHLERFPDEQFDWKPHEKSMSLGVLAGHVAEVISWVNFTLEADELDFAAFKYVPPAAKTAAELVDLYNKNVENAIAALEKADESKMHEMWTMRKGEHVFFTMPKMVVIRNFSFNHTVSLFRVRMDQQPMMQTDKRLS
jgi:uncharacterized damage-inducible protein DinB